jgi:hypothetical protein
VLVNRARQETPDAAAAKRIEASPVGVAVEAARRLTVPG